MGDSAGSQPVTLAQTAWDPWDLPVLAKCFENWPRCNKDFNANVLWNPKDLDPEKSFVEYFLKLGPPGSEQQRTTASPSSIPGRLSFQATHLGPLMSLRERQNPGDPLTRNSGRLGDTVGQHPGPYSRRTPDESQSRTPIKITNSKNFYYQQIPVSE